jgi:beta-lactamase class D/beta-lactamase regulating signal transducer with metallopeptidase domain
VNALDLFGMRFALASCACLATGLAVWGVTTLCRRMLPALALQRSTWVLGQVAVAATFLLVLTPQTAPWRMVPAIDMSEAAPPSAPGPATTTSAATVQTLSASVIHRQAWTVYAARAWMLVYLLGLAWSLARLLQAQRALKRLAGSGVRLAPHAQHAGFPGGVAPLPVIEVAAAISPMLIKPFAPCLLLPQHLRSVDPVQQQLIIEHELTHWRRGDLHWMTVSLALQTLFWFQPVMRLLRARLSWAQELACDRDVLRGRAPTQRKAYAAALVAQLAWQRSAPRPPHVALAFGGVSPESLTARVTMIRTPLQVAGSRRSRVAAMLAVATVFAASLALQPALAWHGEGAADAFTALDCTVIVDAASGAVVRQQGSCDQRVTPASTFNIAVSLMGFDSGILRDAHTPLMPFKPGYIDWNADWRQATDPSSWITHSTVWYAQQVTRQLGEARLAHYLAGFDYGNQDMSGDPGKGNGLQTSWISSSMQISPNEQTAFLRRIVNRQLPVTPHAYDVTTQLLKLPFETGGWQVYGKTGTASFVQADGSEDNAHSYGWFVGWATKGARTVVFARLLLNPTQADTSAGPRVKAAFLRDLPARLAGL